MSDPTHLYNAAVRALMRRAHSVHEMEEYLAKRAGVPEHIPPILEKLREQHYLDDARYARDYARVHVQGRKQGRFRIARELRLRGISEDHIQAALQSIFAEMDESALVRSRIERALRSVHGAPDEKKRAALYRSLLRAGFSADAIRAELRAVTAQSLESRPVEEF